MRTAGLSVRALEMAMRPQGYNFGANLGKAAGAGVDQHIHFHLVPRWNGDTNFMPALGEVKVISHDLLATKKNLTEAFNKLD
jgi:ATP adenylyltransferase